MDKDESGPERTCVVTRRKGSPDAMIRFVLGPEDVVVPDLRRRLPGRGVWVVLAASTVADAVKRRAFDRGFRRKVRVDPSLGAQVDDLLATDALQSLAMANKAGLVTTGFTKVETALTGGGVAVLLHAAEAAEDGVRKLDAVRRRSCGGAEAVKLFSGERLDLALGRTNVIHAALAVGPAGHAFLRRCQRLTSYRSSEALQTGAGVDTAPA